MCFAWISEQTAIISLYSVNLSVFITEAECLLRGTDWVFESYRYTFVLKRLMSWIIFFVASGFSVCTISTNFRIVLNDSKPHIFYSWGCSTLCHFWNNPICHQAKNNCTPLLILTTICYIMAPLKLSWCWMSRFDFSGIWRRFTGFRFRSKITVLASNFEAVVRSDIYLPNYTASHLMSVLM